MSTFASALLACCLVVFCKCDNRYNDRYNQLVNQYDLKKSISSSLPKESKFFDINDFDCEYKNFIEIFLFQHFFRKCLDRATISFALCYSRLTLLWAMQVLFSATFAFNSVPKDILCG